MSMIIKTRLPGGLPIELPEPVEMDGYKVVRFSTTKDNDIVEHEGSPHVIQGISDQDHSCGYWIYEKIEDEKPVIKEGMTAHYFAEQLLIADKDSIVYAYDADAEGFYPVTGFVENGDTGRVTLYTDSEEEEPAGNKSRREFFKKLKWKDGKSYDEPPKQEQKPDDDTRFRFNNRMCAIERLIEKHETDIEKLKAMGL